jgi:NAD(P)-dependent dehydrogenase (short-subunit alcohol dehydrogenase family)
MKSQSPKGGRIVNNGSISVDSPRPSKSLRTSSGTKLITDSFSYTISKHAILGLTHSTSLDGRKHGIVCTQLDIGNAATDLSAHSSKGTFQADGSNKVEPMMDVENVGKTLVFLAKLPLDTDVLRMNIV